MATITPLKTSVDLGWLVRRYLQDLRDAGVPEPERQSLSVAAVLHDLCQLAEVAPPAAVLRALDPDDEAA